MKKKLFLIIGLLICFSFLLTACGGSSIDSIRTKFKDNGYEVISFSQSQIDDVAGLKAGLRVYKILQESIDGSEKIDTEYFGFRIKIYEFNSKQYAEEFMNTDKNKSKYKQLSLKGSVYVCMVDSYNAEIAEQFENLKNEVISLFENSF